MATSSEAARALSSGLLAALTALAPLLSAGGASAAVFHSQQEALSLAFPDAEDLRSELRILSAEEAKRIRELSRCQLESKIVKLYSGWRGGELQGWAYIDVHTVRTLPEAFMVVLDPSGQVSSLRVLAFHEPLDYLPDERWYTQFVGKQPGEPLRVGRDVHGVLGATLSARAVACSVRRVQAFYQVLVADGAER